MLSPCIKKCMLNENNVCSGCLRTLKEIKNWAKMTDLERKTIYNRVKVNQSMITDLNTR